MFCLILDFRLVPTGLTQVAGMTRANHYCYNSPMNKKIIVGNWKTNPSSVDEAKKLIKIIRRTSLGLNNTEVVICPPFPFIYPCVSSKSETSFHIGAQSASIDMEGSHTGEVSAKMLRSIGVEYVIVGHSEQRARGDTDEIVNKKVLNVIENGMKAIVCFGEKNRDTENGSHFDYIKEQIKNTFANIPKDFAKNIILAYEPIWAIGAKEAMVPEQVCEMAIFVKKVFADIFDPKQALKTVVLYGGSVNSINAENIVKIGQVDGLLVGRESLNTKGFADLLKAVDMIV